jgi:UDP:flavonoid glycosyltransferase YjiC (YdhE family)
LLPAQDLTPADSTRLSTRDSREWFVRVVFSSTWGTGHVFPMVPLARAFIAAGHPVLWVGHGQARALAAAAGIDARAGGFSSAEVELVVQRMKASAATVIPSERAAATFPTMFAASATPRMLADLLPIVVDWRPDLIIHEPAELAAPLVASIVGIPTITHSWGSAIPADILRAGARALRDLWQEHGRSVPEFAGVFEGGYLDLCPPGLQFAPVDHIRHRTPLRPMLYSGASASAAIEEADPVDPRPLIYVTLGTVFSDATVLQAAVDGAAATGARVVATVGPLADPGAIAIPSDAVRVARWVNQSALLPHADLVISHAGSGTFFGALANGLPQLCLPQAADQFRNAAVALRSGTGLCLQGEEVNATSVRDAAQRLLHEPSFRDSARRFASEIEHMPLPSSVVQELGKGTMSFR